jgi:hypothetical protein
LQKDKALPNVQPFTAINPIKGIKRIKTETERRMSNFPEMEYRPLDRPKRDVDPTLDALTYLQAVYRGQIEAEGQRMRAAIAALPFEVPRLSINANVGSHDLGDRLERAIKRSGVNLTIEHAPQPRPMIEAPELTSPAGPMLATTKKGFRRL